jgi:hypothetical protein
MRWTDLPRDREPVGDADAPPTSPSPFTLQRGEWEDLRQRLERLPAGHPSSPDGEDRADAGWDDADRPDGRLALDGRNGADQRAGPDERSTPGGRSGPAELGRPDARPAVISGRREPYRPWFAASESPEPWFSADPGG